MSMLRPQLTAEEAEERVRLIIESNPDPEVVEALLDLVLTLRDRKADPIKFAIAERLARLIFSHSQYCEKAFQDFLEGKLDIGDIDNEAPPM
jgi:hypothetical protein